MNDTTLAQVQQKAPHPLRELWRDFARNPGAVAGLFVVAVLVICALFAEWLAPHSPIEQYRDAILAPPSWFEGGKAEFLLGTDTVGRDLLSRLIFGARLSLGIGLVSVTLSLGFGILFGLLAGFSRGWLGTAIMRLMDILLALP